MVELVLIRGLPGSGKSTLANSRYSTYRHFEADMYFVTETGYVFYPSRIKAAHEWCQKQTREALCTGQSVVVSNTFSQQWEMKPYFEMASEFGAKLTVITCTGEYQNIHGVPQAVIDRMRERWEP